MNVGQEARQGTLARHIDYAAALQRADAASCLVNYY
jgi:hypothetical protein